MARKKDPPPSEEIDPSEGRDKDGRFTSANIWTQVYSMYGGRPRIYNDAEELFNKGLEFFEWATKKRKGKITEAGLRLYLGLYKRSTYFEYKHHSEFSNAIAYLESILEDYNEQKLGWGGSTQGAIFWLKNKAGWKDEVIQNQNQTISKVEIVEKKRDD